jgi:hypothetical protein
MTNCEPTSAVADFGSSCLEHSARVAKLADALDLGSSAERRAGSTPASRMMVDRGRGEKVQTKVQTKSVSNRKALMLRSRDRRKLEEHWSFR